MWLFLYQIYSSFRIFKVNGVNFQAQPIFRRFYDRGYCIFEKKSMNLTRPGKVYSWKPGNLFFMHVLFVKFCEMLLIEYIFCYWFKISKIRRSCNMVNMSKKWQKIWSHVLSYTFLKCFLYSICLGKLYLLRFSFWHFCK